VDTGLPWLPTAPNKENPVRTTPVVPAADMSNNALLLDLITADDVFGEDASPAATQRQAAAFAAAEAWWVHRRGRALGELGGPPSRVRRWRILMAKEMNPANLFAIMRGELCRRGMHGCRTGREAWR
jgi:hypothetical protein